MRRLQGEKYANRSQATREPCPSPDTGRSEGSRRRSSRPARSSGGISDRLACCNFDALLSVLDPNVVFRENQRAVAASASGEVRGAQAIARQFMGGTQVARPVLVNGSVGIVVAPYGRLLLVGTFVIRHGKITEIEAITDLARLCRLDPALLPD